MEDTIVVLSFCCSLRDLFILLLRSGVEDGQGCLSFEFIFGWSVGEDHLMTVITRNKQGRERQGTGNTGRRQRT
jgi:hypothetical protein